jgi:hypothetical protein
MKKESDAYFTVEAAILYPIILSVILLMTYLLLFQYDRCLLEQDIGKATVLSGSKWTLTKEQLNDYMQKKALHFDEEKYIAWENEDPLWNLEKNDVILEKTGRLRYPFAGMGAQEKYWSAKASFQADRISPVFWLRRSRNVQNKRDNTEENN